MRHSQAQSGFEPRPLVYSGWLSESLNELNEALIKNQVHTNAPAGISFERFSLLDASKQDFIVENIRKYTRILNEEAEPGVHFKSRRDLEIARAEKSMRTFGLRACKADVFSVIAEDDVVEIYTGAGVQIYRNARFCQLSSYNLLDLSVHSWEELYVKPQNIGAAILALIQQALTGGDETFAYNLGEFVQRETFAFAKSRRMFHVRPKFIVPLMDETSGERIAFLSTYAANIIAEGSESSRIDIL